MFVLLFVGVFVGVCLWLGVGVCGGWMLFVLFGVVVGVYVCVVVVGGVVVGGVD